MSDEKKGKGLLKSISELSFIKKLKSIKHIEIIIVVIFVLLLLLICFGNSNTFGFLSSISSTSSSKTENTAQTYYFDTSEYVLNLENKLKNVLSQIKNSGKVEVMISVDDSAQLTFATDDIITTSGQTIEQQKKVILIESNGKSVPIIIGEKPPNINGIVIVSSGACDAKVKLDIISAVETLIDIDSSKIQVLVGK